MPHARRIAGNVLSNWGSLAITTLVGFFLAPFVVHHLGNLVYGVWVIVAGLVSYMNLLDLGLRGAIARFVSKGVTQENDTEASQAVSGALWIRQWMGAAVICASLALAAGFDHIFVIPVSLHRAAQIAVIVTAVTVAINLCCGLFSGVLVALHRFDLTSTVSISQTCIRAAGVVILLRGGHGIVALALCDLCTSIITNTITIFLCFRVYPRLKVVFGRPDRTTLKKLLTYSIWVFLINVAVQVIYYTDNLVVGAFLSPVAVTMYAIGGILIGYARNIVSSMTTTFMPLASTYEAAGDDTNLRRLLIHGTRAALIVSLPIEVALLLRGHTFIRMWMGQQYADTSGTVMQILLLSMAFSSANVTSAGIVLGMEKHRRVAFWGIGEAIANLLLSIVLVRRIGLYGVAWGTAIPSVIVELLLWPPYISKLVKIPMWTYLWQTWIKTCIAVVPFSAGCFLTELYWPPHNLFMFFLQIALLLPLFPLALAIIFRDQLKSKGRVWIKQLLKPSELRRGYEPSATIVS